MRRMDTSSATLNRLAYSPSEAAAAAGLSRSSIYRAIRRGELRRMKIGRRAVIPAADLAALCGAVPRQAHST